MKIGANIRQLRILRGYSQEYVADCLQISQKTYSQLENDKSKMSLSRLSKIAELFDVSLIHILTTRHSKNMETVLNKDTEAHLTTALNSFNEQLEALREEIRLLREGRSL